MTTKTKPMPTFRQLAKLEPRLTALLKEAKAVKDDRQHPYFCGNAAFYGYDRFEGRGFKPRLSQLVGWGRKDKHPILSTSTAYDVVYDAINDVMPPCRGLCGCLGCRPDPDWEGRHEDEYNDDYEDDE